MKHPEHRELVTENDVYRKVLDILYFYSIGKSTKDLAIKRLNFLKLIVKKTFNKDYLLYIIEEGKSMLNVFDKEAYNKFYQKYKDKIESNNKRITDFI